METKTEEFSNTVVPLFFRQVCTVCLHNLLPNYPSAMFSLEQELISPCFGAYLLSVITLSLDIVSDFDCSCLYYYRTPCPSPKPLAPSRIPRGVRHRDSNCSWLGRSPHHDISPKTPGRSQSPSITFSDSSLSLSQRKAKVTPLFSMFSQKQHSR